MRWYSVSGAPIVRGSVTVTPVARVLTLGRGSGGLFWHFPTHVRVERAGHVERLPIVDVSRLAVYGLYVLAAALTIRLWRTR